MTRRAFVFVILMVGMLSSGDFISWTEESYYVAEEAYYVGEAACRRCHHDLEQRNQFNLWRMSAHADAYASLAMPESKEIAKISGVDVDPFESPICLGCHTTASLSEEWERDETFYFEDGIQCEMCHGPGSEYMTEEVMQNRELSERAGLEIPDEDFCMICHKEKGSHTAVLDVEPFDYEQAMAEIAHKGVEWDGMYWEPEEAEPLPGPKYVGSRQCGECHRGEEMGHQYSQWRLSKHAKAYAILGTREGIEIAREEGILGNPQESPACLQCHVTGYEEPAGRFLSSFDKAQGIHCESCHGAGSEYQQEAVMLDPVASRKAGLKIPSPETCRECHVEGIHGKSFDYETLWEEIQHPATIENTEEEVVYKTPFNLEVNRDESRLYVACEGSDSLIVVDLETQSILKEIFIQNQPHDVALSPDEKKVFVSNRASDTVSVIDTETFEIVDTIEVGDEPHELMTDPQGNRLFVVNTATYDISVIDLETYQEKKRLTAARGAWGIASSNDGLRMYVTNNLSHFVEFRTPSVSEVSVIDVDRGVIHDRIMVPGTNMVQGVDVDPHDEFVMVTMIRTKNLVPMTRTIQGWVMTNGIAILWNDGRVDQLLLDEVNAYFADPTDLVITPDGRYAFVTGAGIDAVAAINIDKMKALLNRHSDQERLEKLPNHLGVSVEYVDKRINVGRSPRGMVVSPDGKRVYVADALDDTISVIDVEKQERVNVIDLEGPEVITLERKGDRIFHNADVTFAQQFTCHSCHPDGNIDGITYDIEPDGIGINPVDNRTLRGILDTAPFKWEGTNPSLSRQCGPRLAVFFTRIDPFTPEQVEALDYYISTIPRPPNRYRLEGEFTPAQRRGKKMFERTHDNMGNRIPEKDRCITCHPPPYFTNREVEEVGYTSYLDTNFEFDVPHLNNIYETAPFLHDGRAETLEEIWTEYNPHDEHGVTNDMTKDQLNDLIEYLKTL